jgi:predicted GNAT family N-acyltransferase
VTTLIYQDKGTHVHLLKLEVQHEERGQGKAREAMRQFVERFSDRRLTLDAIPLDRLTDLRRLVQFYHSFGFVAVTDRGEYVRMERVPEVTAWNS